MQKWSKELCLTKISECNSLKEYRDKFRGAMNYAQKNGFWEEIINSFSGLNYFWSKELCLEKISECDSLKEYRDNFRGAMNYAQKNGFWEEIKNSFELTEKISYEYAKEKISECLSILEFKNKYGGVYNKINNENWKELLIPLKKNTKWTEELCHIEALKYPTKVAFQQGSPNAYDAAVKRLKCIDKICSHMVKPNNFNTTRLIYAYEFTDNSVYIGLTKNIKYREYGRKKNPKDTVNQHIALINEQPIFKQLTELIPAKEAQLKEIFFINKYRSEGWKILNKVKGGSLGGGTRLYESI